MPTTPPKTVAELDELETWENVTMGRQFIKKFGAKGDLMDELINGRKTFHVSTRERHINEEIAASPDNDCFANGTFAPVRLLDTTDDAEEIASNPNVMGEEEMKDLVKANVKTLEKRIKEVRNPVVIERLLQVANDNDTTIGRIEVISNRLTELAPSLYTEIESGTPR